MSEPTSAERKVRSADSLAPRFFDISLATVVVMFGDALAQSLDLPAKAGVAHPGGSETLCSLPWSWSPSVSVN